MFGCPREINGCAHWMASWAMEGVMSGSINMDAHPPLCALIDKDQVYIFFFYVLCFLPCFHKWMLSKKNF